MLLQRYIKPAIALLLAVLLLPFAGIEAFAALPISTATSTASAAFQANNSPQPPLNPESPDPSTPGTPGPPGTNQAGPLSLDYVPSLQFGTNLPIYPGNYAYPHKITVTEFNNALFDAPFLQVTDKRPGNSNEWKVKALAEEMTAVDGLGTHTIDGAKLVFKAGRVNGNLMGQTGVTAPITSAFDLHCTGIVADHTRDVFSSSGDGFGIWMLRWYAVVLAAGNNDFVALSVPAGNVKPLSYSCTITWSLYDAP